MRRRWLAIAFAASTILARVPKHRCVIDVRGQLALVVDVVLSSAMLAISVTNRTMRDGSTTAACLRLG